MSVGNPATAVAGTPGQASDAFWNTEVRDQFNQSLFQAGTALTIATWTASAGTPAVGSTGTFASRYLKHGRLVTFGFWVAPAGTGASFGSAGASWSFTLPVACAVSGSTPCFWGQGRGTPNGTTYFPLTVVLSTSTCSLAGPASSAASNLSSVGQAGLGGIGWSAGAGAFGFSVTYESLT